MLFIAALRSPFKLGARRNSALPYVLVTTVLMVLLYAALYRSYEPDSLPAEALLWYLTRTAEASAWVLSRLGESVAVHGTTVSGRFPYVVVLDCAALDAQALLVAAVVAFPAPWWTRVLGVIVGMVAIYLINVTRLVGLYFAGNHSRQLFNVLHEEVLVFVIIALVCGMFALWARWARERVPIHVLADSEGRHAS